MTNKEAINYLLYMKHDVLANSPYDVALDTAIEALKATAKQPKTNGDRIRKMTDEELADFFCIFCRIAQSCANDTTCSMCPIYDGCAQNVMCVKRWIKQEVQENASG